MNNKTSVSPTARSWYLLFFIWIIATSGTLISLFFSEVMQVPICALCWYQRIALYPLVIMLPLALFPYDAKIIRYISPLIMIGWFTALFHVLVVSGLIPESVQPCIKGIPCSETHVNLFGLLNIPIMSLITFTIIGVLLFLSQKTFTENNHE